MDDIKDFLKRISAEMGVSGYETRVADIVKAEFSRYCDEVTVDKIGNVIGLRKGAGSGASKGKLMLAAHIDEIGLITKCIDEDGYLRFATIGGSDQRVLVAQEVVVHAPEKPIIGVIGIKPPHLTPEDERDKAAKMDDLAIDTGYDRKQLERLVPPGTIVTINQSVIELQNATLAGKSFDDRAGVASLLACMKQLKDFRHDIDVYYVATTQEEVGLHGAKVAGFGIQPDIGIAIDVGFGRTPDLKEHDSIELRKGPSIARGPNMHPAVFEGLRTAAKNNTIPYQIEIVPGGRSGTDTAELQISGVGAASGLLSIPLRYMHTCVETIAFEDVLHTGRLLAAYIAGLNGVDLEAILC